MSMSKEQYQQFDEQGFVHCRGLLSSDEVASLTEPMGDLLNGQDKDDQLHRVREKSGAVRSIFLAHRHYDPYKALIRNPKILAPVKKMLNNDVYIYHSKLNVKDAFEGSVWLWHQDYGYWINDGVDSRSLSVMVFLDQATLNNGCLMVAAGTHKQGRLHHETDTVTTSYEQWCVPTAVLTNNLKEEMIQPITGESGDVLFFHSQILHGSGHNMSPLPRKSFIVVYNDIDNKPQPVENPRPDWVVARQFDVVA
jgi:ectoine hydroxylase